MAASQQTEEKLKVTLVISGAVALGSFESGVIHELTRAARAKRGPFSIDFIAGTSAGSITGAQVAKAMVSPVPDFSSFRLWTDITLDHLTRDYSPGETSPLSQTWIRAQLREQLGKPSVPGASLTNDTGDPYEYEQPPADVRLLVTLTDLEGNVRPASYGEGINVPAEGSWNGVTVTTRLSADTTVQEWQRIAELAVGSSAHSAAWEAVRITVPEKNAGDERWEPDSMHASLLARQQIHGDPYFVDGGTVNNLPLGQALRMIQRQAPGWEARPQRPVDPYRIMLYIDPDPAEVSGSSPEYSHWGQTVRQAFSILTSPPISQGDLRWVAETNRSVVDILRSVGEYCTCTFGHPAIDDGEKVQQYPAAVPQEVMAQAAAAAMPEGWDRLYGYICTPKAPLRATPAKGTSASDLSVDEFYQWLDVVGGVPQDGRGAWDPAGAMDRLLTYLDRSPLGINPADGGDLGNVAGSSGGVLDRIREAVLEVASWYYRLKPLPRPDRLQAMIGFHKLVARHSPAGDRQWVYVTRIVPGQEKPLSRSLAHFGGFLYQPWMYYDYVAGRRCAIRWLREKFPENDYVCKQLRILPELPDVKLQTVEPGLIARNAGALGEIATRIRATLLEEVPWLTSKPVVWLSRAFWAYVWASVSWAAGMLAQEWPPLARLADWVERIVSGYNLSAGHTAVGVSLVFGAVVTWIQKTSPLRRQIQVLVLVWSLLSAMGKFWETVKAVFRPGATNKTTVG